jgi:hypothetical protein
MKPAMSLPTLESRHGVGKGVVENVLFSSSLKQSMIGSGARGKTLSTRPSPFKALRGCPMDKNLSKQQGMYIVVIIQTILRLVRHDIEIRLMNGEILFAGGYGVIIVDQ